ncbi:MAG: sodium:proton antiporter [Verrucomicrobiia bacterium]
MSLILLAGSVWPAVAVASETTSPPEPHPFMVAPFAILLLAIAFMPFIHRHHWENHYPKVAIGLGLVTVLYYLVVLHNGPRMLDSMVEYAKFMALIGSLFVVAGGIHINMTGRSTPAVNTAMLAMGAILANFIGTTGASMVLIRPFLRINKYRIAPHHVVFFIFIVSNIGGVLTPIGDPPLFLGYLNGVPFFWLLKMPQVVLAWLICVGALLALFFVLDTRNFNRHNVAPAHEPATVRHFEIKGARNFIWLVAIIGLVLLQKIAGSWGAVASAVLMIGVAIVAHRFGDRDARRENEFDFAPLREVGFLFAGVFATMVPALDLLERHAVSLGITTSRQFFWGSGLLSGLLDNVPTYLNFLTAAFGLQHLSLGNPSHMQTMLADPLLWKYIVAVSLGSVFFGACTYIGNGPNFMVKSIAESSGVKCPSFFGYIVRYTLPILIPLFALISWLFIR